MPRLPDWQPPTSEVGGNEGDRTRLWLGLVDLGFALLYDKLSWAYDAVSWLASMGHWRRWQATVLPYLPAQGRVLDLACGPGHLATNLSARGYQVVALDASRHMVRRARTQSRRSRDGLPTVLARAQALPFAPGSFEAIAVTFPTAFVYEARTHEQAWRVLSPMGRLVVATHASFAGRGPLPRFMEWLYRITGQRGPAPDLVSCLAATGFVARRERVHVDGTRVSLVVGSKCQPPDAAGQTATGPP